MYGAKSGVLRVERPLFSVRSLHSAATLGESAKRFALLARDSEI